jgi:ribosome-binding factor A
MSPSHRPERIAEMLMEELSVMVTMELRDPRMRSTNVTAVKVSPDLRYARVFVSHAEGQEEDRRVLAALQHAVGYLRRELGQRVVLRYIPELTFEIDQTPARAGRIDQIIENLHQEGHGQQPSEEEKGA